MATSIVLRPRSWRAAVGFALAHLWLGPQGFCLQAAYAAAPTAQGPGAQAALSPVGDWLTIHEETHKATSVVRIVWEGDQLVGRVVQILTSNRGPNPLCEQCTGERHDQPVLGMSILWDLRGKDGSYEGGYVLDPSKGKVYRAKIKMRAPNVLEMRGFIGVSVFGRTQVWQRVPPQGQPSSSTDVSDKTQVKK